MNATRPFIAILRSAAGDGPGFIPDRKKVKPAIIPVICSALFSRALGMN
jgi:hypothetical protein